MPDAATDARHAEILGQPPRLAPLAVAEMSDSLAAMLGRMAALNLAIDSREQETLTDITEAEPDADDLRAALARLPEIARTMARHPTLFTRQVEMGLALLGDGALTARDRELAILRIGWLCRAPYEWGEHVLIAKKVGITGDEIERITLGAHAPGWSAHDAAILRAAEELHADAMISDATWATLAERLDER